MSVLSPSFVCSTGVQMSIKMSISIVENFMLFRIYHRKIFMKLGLRVPEVNRIYG